MILFATVVLTGCSKVEAVVEMAKGAPPGNWVPSSTQAVSFDDAAAETENNASIDMSSLAKGVVGVKATSDVKLKFQVLFGDVTYNYDLPNDGTPMLFPLQSGNGSYAFRVMQNTSGDKYAQTIKREASVTLESGNAPYLIPNAMVNYNSSSACVKKAQELASGVNNDSVFVSNVYEYLSKTIKYDYEFAESSPAVYFPSPDGTLSSAKGICFDYASLAAAMLRSQGIPTKLITGYVSPDNVYHAWNSIYLKDEGWITFEIKSVVNDWQVIDVTFAATAGGQFIGDGTGYTPKYTY